MGGVSANRLTSPLNGDTLGAAGGSENVTLSAAQSGLPAHVHTANHKYKGNAPGTGGSEQYLTTVAEATTDGVDSGFNTGSVTAAAASAATPLLQPTIIAKKIIKT
jgi:microcystin-dependent protein